MNSSDQIDDLTERLTSWRRTRVQWEAALKKHTDYENWDGVKAAQNELDYCDEMIAKVRAELDQKRRQDAIEATL